MVNYRKSKVLDPVHSSTTPNPYPRRYPRTSAWFAQQVLHGPWNKSRSYSSAMRRVAWDASARECAASAPISTRRRRRGCHLLGRSDQVSGVTRKFWPNLFCPQSVCFGTALGHEKSSIEPPRPMALRIRSSGWCPRPCLWRAK